MKEQLSSVTDVSKKWLRVLPGTFPPSVLIASLFTANFLTFGNVNLARPAEVDTLTIPRE